MQTHLYLRIAFLHFRSLNVNLLGAKGCFPRGDVRKDNKAFERPCLAVRIKEAVAGAVARIQLLDDRALACHVQGSVAYKEPKGRILKQTTRK